MQRTVAVEDSVYILSPMTAGDALDIQDEFADKAADRRNGGAWSLRIVAASLGLAPEDARKIPWPHYQELVSPALEINGFKTKADEDVGESQAGASPAA